MGNPLPQCDQMCIRDSGVTTVFDHHASFGHITGSLNAIEEAAKDLGCLLYTSAPSMEDYQAFLDGEVRYNSLKRQNPEKAARLFAKNEAEAKARFEYLQKLIALHSAE